MNFLNTKTIRERKKEICIFLFFAGLWLMIWATYNTDIFRIFSPGFPHNTLDLIHGLRSLLPFLAMILAIIILIKNKKFNFSLFKGPLGLLLLYSIIGIVASLLSREPSMSFYWGMLYLSAIIVLLAVAAGENTEKKIAFVVRINWIIAGLITIGLILVFFLNPGIFSFSTVIQFLHGSRPLETIGGIGVAKSIFDMPGSRPTGLGRYAGVAAIVLFANLGVPEKRQRLFLLFFLPFFFLYLFFLEPGLLLLHLLLLH